MLNFLGRGYTLVYVIARGGTIHMKKSILIVGIILLAAIVLLSSCSENEADISPTSEPSSQAPTPTPSPTPTQTPTPTPEEPKILNPLTGLPIDEEYLDRRPVAIMINNIKQALPQFGLMKADIIYEAVAEGGITRLVAVMKNPSLAGIIGSVRSTRSYYLDLAQGHDALLLHAGASEMAYDDILSRGVTALDAIKGGYEGSLYYRDKDRRKNNGLEHSLMTTGERIEKSIEKSSFRTEHKDGYSYPMSFEQDVLLDGKDAKKISVRMSQYKTAIFDYDEDSGRYDVSQYKKKHMDACTNEQLNVKNVLVLFAKISAIKGDAYGRMDIDLVGSGDGVYAVNGEMVDIKWSKDSYSSPFKYTNPDGSKRVFNAGTSYICIVSSATAVATE